jgi:two-component system, sensor histidine kinase and response regulator
MRIEGEVQGVVDGSAIRGGSVTVAGISENTNILLVDDDPKSLMATEVVLSDLKPNTIKAKSGKEALRLVLEHEFAVILLDVKLPDMDGFQIAEFIRQHKKSRNTPIIFITAYGRDELMISKGYSLGAVDYIFKPIIPEILRAKVGVFIQLFETTAQLRETSRQLDAQNQKELQKRARELEKLNKELEDSNRELDQFAYIASHDLREPLRTITNFIQLLDDKYGEKFNDEAKQYMAFISEGAQRMKFLIKDLLEFSHVGRKELVRENISALTVLENVKQNLHNEIEKTEAVIEADADLEIKVNPPLLQQLLQNLISNSLKFRDDKKPRIWFNVTDQGNKWLFSLKDNGIGISKEHQKVIFQIFQRLHKTEEYPGTGIGLAICEKIVRKHGGRIWVESEFRKGATFFFSMPK